MKLAPLLEARGLKKNYGAVKALRGVDISVRRGETVALVGDNGAGKSTLVKILSGVTHPSEGQIYFNGSAVELRSPNDAKKLGIETVYQDLGLCDNLSVADNVFLGRERVRRVGPFHFLDRKTMRKEAAEALSRLVINAPRPDATIAFLSGGQRQAAALARAKLWARDLILLDEPTAALGVQESRRVIDAVRVMQAQGISLVIISHNIPLVLEICQRVVVLRHGTKVGDVSTPSLSADDIVGLITGARSEMIEHHMATESSTCTD